MLVADVAGDESAFVGKGGGDGHGAGPGVDAHFDGPGGIERPGQEEQELGLFGRGLHGPVLEDQGHLTQVSMGFGVPVGVPKEPVVESFVDLDGSGGHLSLLGRRPYHLQHGS